VLAGAAMLTVPLMLPLPGGGGALTLKLTEALLLVSAWLVAVTVELPGPTAVTKPVSLTVTTSVLLLLQMTAVLELLRT